MPTAPKPHPPADLYCDYTFRVKWDGQVVAGISRVGALKRTTEVAEFREGGDAGTTRKLPGRTQYDPITLERGITHDSAFELWASQVAGSQPPALGFRKEVRIEVYDASGRLALAYDVHRCWPSEYVALSGLEAGSPCCLIQSLTLQNEGWERDTSVGKRSRSRASGGRARRAPRTRSRP
jgi:phage tail-like protein